ncbi:sensor histidine kinase [Tenacibaculum sp.]|uniref:sensor histidine kinase n=1 Tax=Tenacibaculum sp. TaxID=1906242 RepID=UPI003AA8A393
METSSLTYFFNQPHQNGFLVFTLGILFILTVYHFLLYFQHKDKLYLLYSGYTFFIILSQLQYLREGFLFEFLQPISQIAKYPEVYTETYYFIYTFFAFKFLDIKKELPLWYSRCFKGVYVIMIYCVLKLLFYLTTGNYKFVYQGYFYFTIMMTVLGIVMYVPFFKSKSKLKYYMIIGSMVLFATSVSSLLYYLHLKGIGERIEPAYSILYAGFILENILFSLGLGHKQKLILEERNESQTQLIKQYAENEELRKEVQKKLELDIEALNKEAEIKKLEAIKIQYDKELAELTVATLRNQMNPHFIFNSLNSIKRYIIDNDKKEAVFYLNKFSKLIRKILGSTTQIESSLREELEILELYMSIENTRLDNTVNFSISIDEAINPIIIKVPPLITQPFIENAIWHGLALKKTNRQLKVEVLKANKHQVQIDIIDNGIGRVKSKEIKERKIHKRTSVGIKLTEERLQHFAKNYQHKSGVVFTDLYMKNKPAGTKVSIIIPLIAKR